MSTKDKPVKIIYEGELIDFDSKEYWERLIDLMERIVELNQKNKLLEQGELQ